MRTTRRRLTTVLLLFPIIVFLMNGCTNSVEDGLPGKASTTGANITYHPAGWKDNPQHGIDYSTNPENCKACHGDDLRGGSSGVSCDACHHGWGGTHGEAYAENPDNCKACHGADLTGGLISPSCADCHHSGWTGTHGEEYAADPDNCKACHGADLTGGLSGKSCVDCHDANLHHDGDVNSSCNACHDSIPGPPIAVCGGCHPGVKPGSHPTHITENNKGPATALVCADCHDTNNYPLFGEADAAETLADTNVCNACHSPDGAYHGVSDTTIGAKNNWADGAYDGNVLKSGKERWCVGCHDNSPAIIDGVDAPKIGGDGYNYGYFVNGHGNAPNDTELACTDCHDLSLTHIDGELRTYEFDPANYNDGSSYQAGYRLKSIDEQPPLKIPADTRTDNDYLLCFDSGCHVWDDIFGDTPVVTNFNASGPDPPLSYSYGAPPTQTNQHDLHIVHDVTFDQGHWPAGKPWWDSDWDLSTSFAAGYYDSIITCVTCHNVHGAQGYFGSTNEAMIRDGKLVSGRPDAREGFKFSYVQKDTEWPMVTSSGATRANSIGAVFRIEPVYVGWTEIYIGDMCMGCHGTGTPGMCSAACHPSGAYNAIETESYNASETYLEYYRAPN